jgi:hypothetical protein
LVNAPGVFCANKKQFEKNIAKNFRQDWFLSVN